MRIIYTLSLILILIIEGCINITKPSIYISHDSDKLEKLAAQEVRKYIYLRTGKLLSVEELNETDPIKGEAFILGRLTEKVAKRGIELEDLDQDSYIIKTVIFNNSKYILIYGGNSVSTLYAAYNYAELLGVGFYLDSDVIPDKQIPLYFPEFDIKQTRLFEIRGILPFHDFPEGPDWWSIDDYKAIIAQLPKLRMNFIGFNTYPEGEVGPEPMVWIGPSWNIKNYSEVKYSYNSSHFTTFDSDQYKWGYEPMNTGEYYFGASQLFEKDNFGADYMMELGSSPLSFVEQNLLFKKFGQLLSDAFSFAHNLGVKTCIGTQTPLTIPKKVRTHLNSYGKYFDSTQVVKEIYEGIFKRIMICHPLDYYWLWTSEYWLHGVDENHIDETIEDIQSAVIAARNIKVPFTLATCGWVLGPQSNRILFDNFLPKDMPMSALNQSAGFMPIEPKFYYIKDRPKWAIPWLEDDAALITPQLWVGRMRRDAADALSYGCTGLIGIHWRTRILGPNISALSHAGWTHQGWNQKYLLSEHRFSRSEPSLTSYETGIKDRDLPAKDFYIDWAKINFGGEASEEIADIFCTLDGGEYNIATRYNSNLPRPSTWVDGPGGIMPDERPWEEVRKEYQFIYELEDLRPKIKGEGNLERFDYWLNQFKYTREIAHLNCIWFKFNNTLKETSEINDSEIQQKLTRLNALPLRIEMVEILTKIQNYLLTCITTYGGLGNVTNWQQHIIPQLIRDPGILLEKFLGEKLPEEAELPKKYTGLPHFFISKLRTILEEGESLNLRIRTINVDNIKPLEVKIYWRELGTGLFKSRELANITRGVYEFQLDSNEIPNDGIEYYVQVKFRKNEIKRFPTTAPYINQTVIILPE